MCIVVPLKEAIMIYICIGSMDSQDKRILCYSLRTILGVPIYYYFKTDLKYVIVGSLSMCAGNPRDQHFFVH